MKQKLNLSMVVTSVLVKIYITISRVWAVSHLVYSKTKHTPYKSSARGAEVLAPRLKPAQE